jgi:hypothetical protein
MGNGFVPVKVKPEKVPAKRAKLTPISQIQTDLSSYFNDLKDPRVNRTKKHLLTGLKQSKRTK